MSEPREQSILELVSTEELLNELHRRSNLFVYIHKPLSKAPDADHDFKYGCSVDGGKMTNGAVIRAVGYMELAKVLMLKDE